MEATVQASHAGKLELVREKLRLADALCRATDMLAGAKQVSGDGACPHYVPSSHLDQITPADHVAGMHISCIVRRVVTCFAQ